jgi:hypothetical protein
MNVRSSIEELLQSANQSTGGQFALAQLKATYENGADGEATIARLELTLTPAAPTTEPGVGHGSLELQ